jgi:hypothetical protein
VTRRPAGISLWVTARSPGDIPGSCGDSGAAVPFGVTTLCDAGDRGRIAGTTLTSEDAKPSTVHSHYYFPCS